MRSCATKPNTPCSVPQVRRPLSPAPTGSTIAAPSWDRSPLRFPVSLASSIAVDGKGDYIVFDPPCSGATVPIFITNDGEIGGFHCKVSHCASNTPEFGFIYKNGQISEITFPDALQTAVVGIGPDGEIVGISIVNNGIVIGTFYSASFSVSTEFVAVCPQDQRPCTR